MEGSLGNHLNTQGCCFLCLRSKDPLNDLNGVEFNFYSLKCLLRHLQIDKISEGKRDTSGVKVNLCDECRKITGTFSKLFQDMEKIQIEMNYILERIHIRILTSAKNSNLVQNYSKRMTSDLQSLSELVVVDKLRKQVENKCLKMQKGPKLRVELPRHTKLPIKEEIAKADDDHPGQDDFDSVPIVADCLLFKLPPPTYSTASEDFPEEELGALSSVKNSIPIAEKLPPPNIPKRSKNLAYFKSQGMYHCKECPKIFKSRIGVSCHYKLIHSKSTFKCDICKVAQFATTKQLKRHQGTCRENLKKQLAKLNNPEFKFICKCKKFFKTRQALRAHLKSHSNIRKFSCDLCDKRFKTFGPLKDHKETIHFGRKFNCRFCNRIFSQRSTRGKHEKSCVHRPNEN